MRMEDMILVSIDDHYIEPPDMYKNHVPKKWLDQAPKVVRNEQGVDEWVFQGERTSTPFGMAATVGWPREEWGFNPGSYTELRPGCFDVHERVRDMNANGVLGSLCFPSFPNLCGQLFARSSDPEAAHAILCAYNDWHVDEWCGSYPGRFIPCGLVPIWDPHLMAAEVRRLAAKGCHAVSFSENPAKLKLPSFHSGHWDPFWAACVDEGTIVCLHIGSSSSLVITAPDAPVDVLITLQPVNIVQAAADLLWSPVLRRFPDLRIALSEGGIGWLPYFYDRVDWIYTRHRFWTGQDFGGRLPSEVFRERVVTCFIDDPAGVANLERVGTDNVCWEADYPHSDSTWPTSPEHLKRSIDAAGLDDETVRKVTHLNAMRLFRFDPFAHRPPERATVGALRAEAVAAAVDVSERSAGRRAEHKTGAMDLIRTRRE